MEPSKGKKFYGSATVSERGQIVIPAGARRDFGIKPGAKLLVFGDLDQGLAMATVGLLRKTMEGAMALLGEVATAMEEEGLTPGDAGEHDPE
ncbi:MAG: AbrB/MazE/SpoVT family DNA-binding domain-containing protein [Bacillota bacterium]|jgi:AbrB family looped-hinge helix DNA binding protein